MIDFLITVDTEGDNLWNYKSGSGIIKTENAKFLPRFQDLCGKYGFKPVYLTNYEMATDPFFVEFGKETQSAGKCEIGMHLHAWNTPPSYNLPAENSGLPYLIEYPFDIMKQKIETMDNILTKNFGKKPVSHRAGRWATDSRYFDLLIDCGYKADCSATPHINWKKSPGQTKNSFGSDYSKFSEKPLFIKHSSSEKKILEVPVTIRNHHGFNFSEIHSFRNFLGEIKRFVLGRTVWIRPNLKNTEDMIKTAKTCKEYIMFMIHSSELMPGGSPNFKTEESIERLYESMEEFFSSIHSYCKGTTLREFCDGKDGGVFSAI